MSLSLTLIPVALGAVGLELWGKKVGDCRVRLRTDQISEKTLYYADHNHVCLRFAIPFTNNGRQQALMIDAQANLQPAGDKFSALQPVCRWINPEVPRTDGYWEACIIKPGGELLTYIELWLSAADVRSVLEKELSKVRIDCLFKYYGRSPMHYERVELLLDFNTFREVEDAPTQKVVGETPTKKSDPKGNVVPLRTRLLRPGDDLVELVAQHVKEVGKPGDIVALAETVVAICQGRIAYCEDIKPRYLATRLNKLFDMNSSLSSVYALEMAFREVGVAKILVSMAVGVIGKLRGKPGEFYRLAGRAVATIDDCTGTLPPFDKHVVMGPARGDALVAEIKAKTGLEATIVDANDLGKVDVLHLSDPSRHDEVVEALKPNPQGNAGEMTPLVLIRSKKPAPAPKPLPAASKN